MRPTSAAAPATSTGTPAGEIGTSTSAISPPSAATARARLVRASAISRARKKAGKRASSPSRSGSPMRSALSAPITVPVCQVRNCTELAPNSNQRSNVPSPRDAIAQEASTTVWPWRARLSGPPGSDGPSAAPIARKREFMSVAADIAAPAPPPAARIATAVNCAEPAKTTSDIRIASRAVKPAC